MCVCVLSVSSCPKACKNSNIVLLLYIYISVLIIGTWTVKTILNTHIHRRKIMMCINLVVKNVSLKCLFYIFDLINRKV